MYPDEFCAYLLARIAATPTPAITDATSFADAGVDRPVGVVLTTATGGRLYLQCVGSHPLGTTAGPRPTEGPVLQPVPLPALAPGPLAMADLENWLVAVARNGGHTHIADIHGYAQDRRRHHRYGMDVRYHNGQTTHCMALQALPAGQRPDPHREYQPAQAI